MESFEEKYDKWEHKFIAKKRNKFLKNIKFKICLENFETSSKYDEAMKAIQKSGGEVVTEGPAIVVYQTGRQISEKFEGHYVVHDSLVHFCLGHGIPFPLKFYFNGTEVEEICTEWSDDFCEIAYDCDGLMDKKRNALTRKERGSTSQKGLLSVVRTSISGLIWGMAK
jgi:hypothetical protein